MASSSPGPEDLCPRCNYDLRGIDVRLPCPECGIDVITQRPLLAARDHYYKLTAGWWFIGAVIVAFVSIGLIFTTGQPRLWPRALPLPIAILLLVIVPVCIANWRSKRSSRDRLFGAWFRVLAVLLALPSLVMAEVSLKIAPVMAGEYPWRGRPSATITSVVVESFAQILLAVAACVLLAASIEFMRRGRWANLLLMLLWTTLTAFAMFFVTIFNAILIAGGDGLGP